MNAQQREAIAFLETSGAEHVHMTMGRKHPRVVFEWKGEEMFYVLPGTPGDTLRGAKNAISDLRRMLGLTPTAKRIGERRMRKAYAPEVKAAPPERLTDLPDWRQSLLSQLSAIELELLAREAFASFWRHCMAQVGGRSVL